jgi:hypothetical protein
MALCEARRQMRRRELSMKMVDSIEAWKADGFDHCVVGVGEQFTEGGQVYIFIYSKKAIIETIANDIVEEINNRVNTTEEERAVLRADAYDQAYEYFEYNIAGAYIGRGMPVFMEDTVEDAVGEALGD